MRDGTVATGVVPAADVDAARALLIAREIYPVHVRASRWRMQRRAASTHDLATGFRMFAALLNAGMTVMRALPILREAAPPAWKDAVPHLEHQIARGGRTSDAFESCGLGVPQQVVAMIRSGEARGDAAGTMDTVADLLESRATTRTALRNALAYPGILAAVGGASIVFLTTVVLPSFAVLVSDAGGEPPAIARVILASADLAAAASVPVLVLAVIGLVAWRAWVGSPDGREGWHRLLLATPLLGPMRSSVGSGAICIVLAALIRSGIQVRHALALAADAAGDAALARRMRAASQRVERGESLSRALTEEQALTVTATNLIRVGEETGDLASLIEHAGKLESTGSIQQLQNWIRLIEPAVIIAFGIVVMLIAASMLQTMYSIRPV